MRLDHLLSKEEEVKVVLLLSCQRLKIKYSGGDARRGHTRSIPNTMVKTDAADNTWLETTREDRWLPDLWGISSVGRAPALQAGGHEFESRILH